MNRLLLLLMLAYVPLLSPAQSLSGTITDENDEPIIGGIIEASQNGLSSAKAVFDIDGYYVFEGLPVGKYDITVSYCFYKAVTIPYHRVKAGSNKLDIQMSPNVMEGEMFCCSFYLIQQRTDCFSWEYTNKFFDEHEERWFYPNPATDVINISYKDVSGQFYITDMTGTLVRTFAARPEGKSSVDVSGFVAGFYIISYEYANNKRISGKFTVLR